MKCFSRNPEATEGNTHSYMGGETGDFLVMLTRLAVIGSGGPVCCRAACCCDIDVQVQTGSMLMPKITHNDLAKVLF